MKYLFDFLKFTVEMIVLIIAFVVLLAFMLFAGCIQPAKAEPAKPIEHHVIYQPYRIADEWTQADLDWFVVDSAPYLASIGVSMEIRPIINLIDPAHETIATLPELFDLCVTHRPSGLTPILLVRDLCIPYDTNGTHLDSEAGFTYPAPGGICLALSARRSRGLFAHEALHNWDCKHPNPVADCLNPAIARNLESYCFNSRCCIIDSDKVIALKAIDGISNKSRSAAKLKPEDALP